MNTGSLDVELAEAHRDLTEATKAARHWTAKARLARDRIAYVRGLKKRELRLIERVAKRIGDQS